MSNDALAQPMTAQPDNSRLEVLKWAFDRFGLPTVLLALGISVWAGWIPSPVLEASQEAHKQTVLLTKHVEFDPELLYLLRQNCMALQTLAKRDTQVCVLTPDR